MTPRPEATAAAHWWATQLAGPVAHDTGDEASSATATRIARSSNPLRDQDQIDAFREALADAIEEHLLTDDDSWRPDNPQFGSALRAIANDYGPDPILTEAAAATGTDLGRLEMPLKTTMWINPGSVRVAAGFSAPIETIWTAP